MKTKRWLKSLQSVLVATMASMVCLGGLHAQSYPSKPIKLVIPYAPGGSTDQIGRLVAKELAERLGQPLVVENRLGAGGTIGQEAVAKATADGYTLLFSAAGPLSVTPHLYPNLPYDPLKAFEPVTLIATQPLLLVVKPSLKAQNVEELIALAKNHPGKLSYASFGNGSAAHLAGEYFKSLTQTEMVHVPYKGSGPALVDLVAGQVDLMFDVFSTAAPLVKAGKLRALAITSPDRSAQFPQVPTMQQAGVAGFDAGTWFGLLAPAATPAAVIERLSKETNSALQSKEARDVLAGQGASVRGGSSGDFKKYFQAEYDKWGRIVKSAAISNN